MASVEFRSIYFIPRTFSIEFCTPDQLAADDDRPGTPCLFVTEFPLHNYTLFRATERGEMASISFRSVVTSHQSTLVAFNYKHLPKLH